MKKALVVLLALTCLSALAFADDVAWTFGAMVKTGALITIPSTGSTTIVVNDADDPTLSRIRLDAEAALGDFAAHIRVGGDLAGSVAVLTTPPAGYTGVGPLTGTGPFLNAWWVNAYFLDKMIQLQFGNLDHSVTDTVNKGWGGISVQGGQVVVTPISGLSVGLAIPVGGTAGTIDAAFAGMKVGFAYTMPNLVTVKGTWMNAGGTNFNDAAFGVAVLAVPNLTAQLEVLLTDLSNTTITNSTAIFENVAYVMGPLTPAINATETLYGVSGSNMMIAINPNVDYVIMTGTAVGLSVTYTMNNNGLTGGTASGLNVDPYVAFTFNAKAALKIDFNYTIADLSATGTWALPININFKYVF
jgi:hypothetical protein